MLRCTASPLSTLLSGFWYDFFPAILVFPRPINKNFLRKFICCSISFCDPQMEVMPKSPFIIHFVWRSNSLFCESTEFNSLTQASIESFVLVASFSFAMLSILFLALFRCLGSGNFNTCSLYWFFTISKLIFVVTMGLIVPLSVSIESLSIAAKKLLEIYRFGDWSESWYSANDGPFSYFVKYCRLDMFHQGSQVTVLYLKKTLGFESHWFGSSRWNWVGPKMPETAIIFDRSFLTLWFLHNYRRDYLCQGLSLKCFTCGVLWVR